MSFLISPIAGPSTAEGSTSLATDYEMDAETRSLIAKLALEDLVEIFNRRKGKSRADAPPTDEEVAYELQCLLYQQIITQAEDERMAKSTGEAVSADESYLEALAVAEEAAAADRRAAEMLSRGEPMPEQSPAQARVENPAFVLHPSSPRTGVSARKKPEKRPAISDSDSDDEDCVRTMLYIPAGDPRLQNKSFTSKGKAGPSVKRHISAECTICADKLRSSRALHTPCNHYYCSDCIISLVDSFIRDESLFPLRCCKEPIPVTDIPPFIAPSLYITFLEKHNEYGVSAKDRVYCVTPTCSTFLGSSEGVSQSGILCTDCWTSTCPRCKQIAHDEEICPINRPIVELRALARQEGWQTCPGCETVVELELGCYHMTCLCRSQFCYLCSAPWKSCECPQWDEARLYATAQQRVENELGALEMRQILPGVLAQHIQERAEALRENHHCESHVWGYRHGGGECGECHYDAPSYLMICKGCSILACRRCSLNRL